MGKQRERVYPELGSGFPVFHRTPYIFRTTVSGKEHLWLFSSSQEAKRAWTRFMKTGDAPDMSRKIFTAQLIFYAAEAGVPPRMLKSASWLGARAAKKNHSGEKIPIYKPWGAS